MPWFQRTQTQTLQSGPSCSNIELRYPPDKSLSSGSVVGKPIALSIGQRFIRLIGSYPSFKQLGPGVTDHTL